MKQVIVLLSFCAGLLGYWCFTGYLAADVTFYACLLLAPFVTIVRGEKSSGLRWAALGLFCLCSAWFLPARTLHFFVLAFTALFVLENRFGRLNALPLVLAFLMSALAKNWIMVFGFPIRLTLSRWAAALLSGAGFEARAEGNLMVVRGREYLVDPACMGLSMVQLSLLFLLAMLALFERRCGRRLAFGWVVWALCPAVLLLNAGYNLLRIMLLTLLDWMPGTAMHEIGGLVGLGLYVFLPTWFLVKWAYRFLGKTAEQVVFSSKKHPLGETRPIKEAFFEKSHHIAEFFRGVNFAQNLPRLVQGILLLGLCQIAFFETARTIEQPQNHYPTLSCSLPGEILEQTTLSHGVLQYKNERLLIYLKPIRGFFSSEHSPLICWEGSGYRFSESGERRLADGRQVYFGLLKKETSGECLHTAWWYSNGQVATSSQLQWRWLDFRGEKPFFLVNTTATTEADLLAALANMELGFE